MAAVSRQAIVLAMSALLITPGAGPSAGPSDQIGGAVLDGRPIEAHIVSRYHCHDGTPAEIRCFHTASERDADAAVAESFSGTPLGEVRAAFDDVSATSSSGYYVLWYEHANYGGASFLASAPYTNLDIIGWNDVISSFKTVSGQRPKWWEGANYTYTGWQWAHGAWVSYVGNAANDTFSSVKNLP